MPNAEIGSAIRLNQRAECKSRSLCLPVSTWIIRRRPASMRRQQRHGHQCSPARCCDSNCRRTRVSQVSMRILIDSESVTPVRLLSHQSNRRSNETYFSHSSAIVCHMPIHTRHRDASDNHNRMDPHARHREPLSQHELPATAHVILSQVRARRDTICRS